MTIKWQALPNYAVIIRCMWDRGETQRQAFAELNRRSLYLSPEQQRQAERTTP